MADKKISRDPRSNEEVLREMLMPPHFHLEDPRPELDESGWITWTKCRMCQRADALYEKVAEVINTWDWDT